MLDALVGMPLLGGVFGYVVPFLLLLTLVVFVHEMGHYLAARWRGIHSEAVAVGFGPEIAGWTDAAGTRWRLCWIPIGGYVQFRGDTEPSSTGASPSPEPGSFAGAALLSRAIVVAAGPVMNFLFAAVIFALVAGIPGLPGDGPEVGLIDDSQMAADLGLQEGDRIERVNGVAVETAVDVLRRLQEGDGGPVFLTVLREGDRLSLSAPGRPCRLTGWSPTRPRSWRGCVPAIGFVRSTGRRWARSVNCRSGCADRTETAFALRWSARAAS